MMYVSFIIPFVLAYMWYAWRAVSGRRITEDELNNEDHVY
jgi:cytochrome d ubiquinol oxidase subunit II